MTKPVSSHNSDAPETARYQFAPIEAKWQAYWEERSTFRTPNPGDGDFDPSKPKYFCLDFFPYPSGAGLHVGHPEGYTATDVLARWRRMCGYNVLHPMGWDAFGLPAEQYAIETNTHPRVTTQRNVDNFRRQLKSLGFSYDWAREIGTTDEAYFRWTQWIFLQLFNSYYDRQDDAARPISKLMERLESGALQVDGDNELCVPGAVGARPWSSLEEALQHRVIDAQRLAYVSEAPVNWCPALGTVLSNEEVTADGRSERGNHPVFRRPLKQWMLRITAFADRLLTDLEPLDWPEPVKIMQRNWIGRSTGARVKFGIANDAASRQLEIFTTRPDTLFGATYMVLSPEHPLLDPDRSDNIIGEAWGSDVPEAWRGTVAGLGNKAFATPAEAVAAYRAAAVNKSERDRTTDVKQKTGVFVGAYALNPVYEPDDPRARVPIFAADYVLMGYGTGAIMAVPAHDERDFEFASALELPIRDVVYPSLVLAMKHFADHADQSVRSDDKIWRKHLSAMLGAVASRNISPDGYGALLDQIRLGVVATGGADAAPWMEMLKSLELEQFEDLAGMFHEARYHERRESAFTGEAFAVNSSSTRVSIDGMTTEAAKKRMIEWLLASRHGGAELQYKLRDWLFSRQRYWGEPFPIVHGEDGRVYPLAESELPVTLPEMADFRPRALPEDSKAEPEPPLGRAKEWVAQRVWIDAHGAAHCIAEGSEPPQGVPVIAARRETNTMPQWAGSCWYYLRFCDPRNDTSFCAPQVEKYWMVSHKSDGKPHIGGVDLYLGGTEHAVLHLLYARFWHKALFDLGHVSTPEPFGKLFNQGMIRSFCYRDARGVPYPYEAIDFREDGAFLKETGEKLNAAVEKMSKTLKNVINPDDVVSEVGADSLRLYELFMGPLDASKPWNPRDVPGVYRFLQRVWRLVINTDSGALKANIENDPALTHGVKPESLPHRSTDEVERALNRTIQKVEEDLARMAFNTAIAAMMEFVNTATSAERVYRDQLERFLLVLAPFAPHIAEELWQVLRGDQWHRSLAYESFPTYDVALTVDAEVEIMVQINGKRCTKIMVATDASDDAVQAAAMAEEKVAAAVSGRTIKMVRVVPGRLVNIVVA